MAKSQDKNEIECMLQVKEYFDELYNKEREESEKCCSEAIILGSKNNG